MKAIDLEKYLRSSGLFKVDEYTTMAEIIDGTINQIEDGLLQK